MDWQGEYRIEVAEPRAGKRISDPIYETRMGAMFCAPSEKLLWGPQLQKRKGQAQLIFTSPPFPLNTKKSYGNLQGESYVRWFASFAPILTKYLTPSGSIVIEVGNAWEPSRPVMSTVVLKGLLRFLEKGGLRLCQEFVWYNPARLPSPIQWVNVERIRVKDAFTRIWWMSPTDRPKADNRRVLREYSASMKRLLKTGKYNSGLRPSEHTIGENSFARNNKGAIPSNVIDGDEAPSVSTVLKGTNTRANDQYQLFCRGNDLPMHPARMPAELAQFFIRFLTEPGDLVLDPFAGSNTTGSVAEKEGRRWMSVEAEWKYAAYSISRFAPDDIKTTCSDIRITSKARRKGRTSQASQQRRNISSELSA